MSYEATIKDTINQLDLSAKTREELEWLAAEWYIAAIKSESDYVAGQPSWGDILKTKPHVYKKSKRTIKQKDIVIHESKSKGRYLQAEIRGRLSEIAKRREVCSKNGKIGNAQLHPEHALARKLMEQEYEEKNISSLPLKEQANFTNEMKDKHTIYQDAKNIERAISKLKK